MNAIVGYDARYKQRHQPMLLSIAISGNFLESNADMLHNSLSYSTLSKRLTSEIPSKPHSSMHELTSFIFDTIFEEFDRVHEITLECQFPKLILRTNDCGIVSKTSRVAWKSGLEAVHCLFARNIMHFCIIGINLIERVEKQRIEISLKLFPHALDIKQLETNFKSSLAAFSKFVERSQFRTLELLTAESSNIFHQCQRLEISVRKPNALLNAESAELSTTRYFKEKIANVNVGHVVFVALGSNIGNRLKNIHNACSRISLSDHTKIIDSSLMYRSSPMYVKDQEYFANSIIKVQTLLDPHDLLRFFKEIEVAIGRRPSAINGPRIIDIDIIIYGTTILESDLITIPHPRMTERKFVLQPLCDIEPELVHPVSGKAIRLLLDELELKTESDNILSVAFPIDKIKGSGRTFVMGIINTTPDSFSDGGDFIVVDEAVKQCLSMIDMGVDIIDVGGCSTRPGAKYASESEELSRVIPVIEGIRKLSNVPISIDTFRVSVAKAAIEAGADMINDVTGGTGDPGMLQYMAESAVPVCLMHSRGNSQTMSELDNYGDNPIAQVINELSEILRNAINSGIKKWNIIIDPGIGFAKNSTQNLSILKDFVGQLNPQLKRLPILFGPSRKKFLGEILQEPQPKKRIWGNAAAVCAAVHQGVSIVRVHDVCEMKQVAAVADRIWR